MDIIGHLAEALFAILQGLLGLPAQGIAMQVLEGKSDVAMPAESAALPGDGDKIRVRT